MARFLINPQIIGLYVSESHILNTMTFVKVYKSHPILLFIYYSTF